LPFYVGGWTGEAVGVEDAAAALILAAEKGRNGERYIISERFMSVRELYATAADAAGVDPPRSVCRSGPCMRWVTRATACASCSAEILSSPAAACA